MKHVLTIAGSDSSAGAGIQADLKTFAAHNVYGVTAITAITAQNTTTIKQIYSVGCEVLKAQLEAISEDIELDAIKIGMLYSAENAGIVSEFLQCSKSVFTILDPVIMASSGRALVTEACMNEIEKKIIPYVDLITPNCNEAGYFSGVEVKTIGDMKKACQILFLRWNTAVLLKGGHLDEAPIDLFYDGNHFVEFEDVWSENENTHGTGCTLSSAIAANMAKGDDWIAAIRKSKRYTRIAIENGFSIGKGPGPLNHFSSEDYKNMEEREVK